MKTINYPKILVGCITSDAKLYCQEEFFEQLKKITYPNKEILFVDNSETNENYKRITKAGFKAIWIKRKNRTLGEALAESHNMLRQHVLNHGYQYLFHNETDIFFNGNYDIIQMLLHHRKMVIGAVYDMGSGDTRQLCVFLKDGLGGAINYYPVKDSDIIFMDGNLHIVGTCGIGACLIHKSVFERVRFRYDKNHSSMPDMHFARDINSIGIDFIADTSLYLSHKNEDWGIKGIHYQ
jgi:GT2 family glycosyltransferase